MYEYMKEIYYMGYNKDKKRLLTDRYFDNLVVRFGESVKDEPIVEAHFSQCLLLTWKLRK
jgi:hypothetical protein